MGARGIAAVCATAFLWSAGTAAAATPYALPTLTLSEHPEVLNAGEVATLTGRVSGLTGPGTLLLYASAYPYRSSAQTATTPAGAGGAFEFRVKPGVNTRYRVVLQGTSVSQSSDVEVIPRASVSSRALPLGRAGMTVILYLPSDVRWGGATVRWSIALGRGRFTTETPTKAIRLSRHALKLTDAVTLPAGPYRWQACLIARGTQAFANPSNLPGCTGLGFAGRGSLPVGYPGPAAIAAAARYLAGRTGRTGFAVIDSEGRLSGVRYDQTWVSASVVKAMLLVAYLRMIDAQGQHTVGAANAFLYPMINVSDNTAATTTWSIVGNARLIALAHLAGMTHYSITTDWASSYISPADQARFFFEMNSLIPPEFVGYANSLLSGIAAFESWGIPAIARPLGYTVYFKGGWRPTVLGQLVHQVARLHGPHGTFAIAVMTDGDPSMGYGIDTIQGVTSALL